MQTSTWLTNDQLREMAIDLIFHDRLPQRLEYLYRTHAETNGLEMFDTMERVLKDVQRRIDAHLCKQLPLSEVAEDGSKHKLYLKDMRERSTLPTHFEYPTLLPKSTHVGWHDVERARENLLIFKLKKELEALRTESERVFGEAKAKIEARIKESEVRNEHGLTAREKILIHSYEGKEPIPRKDKRYNDYLAFCTPTKRKAYPNDSPKRAKSLVKSIEKILPLLSESAKQQAENEKQTIEANFL